MRKKITIEGMHCASCAANIERSLKKVRGITEVSISVLTKKGFVEASSPVEDEAIRTAVRKAGYKVTETVDA
ncbi:MAG: heavy metal-associated domain-containing protein [Nanoarchaeota archaeon]